MTPRPHSSGFMGSAALAAIWLYRRSLSPALYFIGVRCRHMPSCSEYAAEAFSKHRFGRAFWLSLSRFCRCHPFGSHGFDPVPEEALHVGWKLWKLGDWAWTERGMPVERKRSGDEADPPTE